MRLPEAVQREQMERFAAEVAPILRREIPGGSAGGSIREQTAVDR